MSFCLSIRGLRFLFWSAGPLIFPFTSLTIFGLWKDNEETYVVFLLQFLVGYFRNRRKAIVKKRGKPYFIFFPWSNISNKGEKWNNRLWSLISSVHYEFLLETEGKRILFSLSNPCLLETWNLGLRGISLLNSKVELLILLV